MPEILQEKAGIRKEAIELEYSFFYDLLKIKRLPQKFYFTFKTAPFIKKHYMLSISFFTSPDYSGSNSDSKSLDRME